MKKSIFVMLFLGFFALNILASSDDFTKNYDSVYKNLIEKLKSGKKDIDFDSLREVYVNSSYYHPYGDKESKKLRLKVADAFSQKKYKKVLELSKSVFEKDFMDLNTHYMCLIASKKLNNKEKEDFHKFFINGMVDAIIKKGDGKSTETAYKIITTREEEFILTLLGYVTVTRHEIRRNGHIYDKIFAENLSNGKKKTFYFNKDIPNNWLNKNCGSIGKKEK